MSLREVRNATGRVLALLVAGLVLLVIALAVVVPRVGGGTPYTVLTGSMRPGMPPGTVVVVRQAEPETIKVGDIVTYQLRSDDPMVVTHRVAAIGYTLDGELRFTTQGDANEVADPELVRPVQIRGVRWYTLPLVGYPALMLEGQQRQVVLMLSVGSLLGYAAWMFAGAGRDRLRRRTEVSS